MGAGRVSKILDNAASIAIHHRFLFFFTRLASGHMRCVHANSGRSSVTGAHLCVNHACSTSTRLISARFFLTPCDPPPGAIETCATKEEEIHSGRHVDAGDGGGKARHRVQQTPQPKWSVPDPRTSLSQHLGHVGAET